MAAITVLELAHPSDPRFLVVQGDPPERVRVRDVGQWKFGAPLLFNPFPGERLLRYEQPNGFGTDWVRPG